MNTNLIRRIGYIISLFIVSLLVAWMIFEIIVKVGQRFNILSQSVKRGGKVTGIHIVAAVIGSGIVLTTLYYIIQWIWVESFQAPGGARVVQQILQQEESGAPDIETFQLMTPIADRGNRFNPTDTAAATAADDY